MLKKFLAFIGLSSIELEDGKAKLEMTEEQMEASGNIISERDDAVAEVTRLTAELEEERQQNTTAQADLQKAKDLAASLKEENTALKEENATLKQSPATETSAAVTDKNKEALGEADPNVTKGEDFVADMNAIKEAYL